MQVYFPIAGQGARFGHRFKPFLTLGARTFIEAAVEPFRAYRAQISRFLFVCLEEQEQSFDVSRRLREMFAGLPVSVVKLDAPTRGPAETIARAVEQVGATGSAFICDCDHEVEVAPLFSFVTRGEHYDALLPVWPLDRESVTAWSVARSDRGRVTAIAEKRLPPGVGGDVHGVIGCYGFRDVAEVARRAVSLGATNVSDVIVEMIRADESVRCVPIERAVFFGDPDRLEKALQGGDR